ncbi:hypothetical protein [Nonomuraea sp. NPDC049400]
MVLGNEVAELFLIAHKGKEDEIASTATALRSQLSGRICHRVNDARPPL